MAICEKCGKEHDGSFGTGRFCSLHCQNSNPCKEEVRQKLKEIWQEKRKQKQEELEQDIRICEKCGKEFSMASVGKFASGRFCSHSCSNTHSHTDKTKIKIKNSVENTYRDKSKTGKLNKDIETRICIICGKSFQVKHKYNRQCCSTKCSSLLIKQTKIKNGTLKTSGGYRKNANRQYGGYYKGQWCDSRWELAFLIYHLDNNILIEKCNEYFEYNINNRIFKYYPDFKINNVYYEIKGRWRQNLDNKLQAVRDKGFEIKLITKEDIKPYLDYCYDKYKTRKLETLYEV